MSSLKLRDFCEYCNIPFGQSDHTHCLARLKKVEYVEKAAQRLVRLSIFYLRSKRYAQYAVKTCWCGEIDRWRGRQCHAHTHAWIDRYGGRLVTETSERRRLAKEALKQPRLPRPGGVSKADAGAMGSSPCPTRYPGAGTRLQRRLGSAGRR